MRAFAGITGVLAGVCVAGGLAGCAQFVPFQRSEDALFHVGMGKRYTLTAADYVGHFTPYAILAARAYEKLDAHGNLAAIPGNTTRFVSAEGVDYTQLANQWLSRWTYVTGEEGPICKDADDRSCSKVSGLQYNIWRRDDCSEIAIVFRGTDQGSIGDWLSNFHGVLRVLPLFDQYEQVQAAMDRIIKTTRRSTCRGRTPRIVSVGHSLGGGLAQQAAYMTKAIRHVYAFDPSFITGYSDPHSKSAETEKGLTIDRVYEHGEVLAYARFFIRRLRPETACNPTIRGFRVDLIHGQPIFQHSMDRLAAAFIGAAGPRPYDSAHARKLPTPLPGEHPECDQGGDAGMAAR